MMLDQPDDPGIDYDGKPPAKHDIKLSAIVMYAAIFLLVFYAFLLGL